jgi:hypothetical protein
VPVNPANNLKVNLMLEETMRSPQLVNRNTKLVAVAALVAASAVTVQRIRRRTDPSTADDPRWRTVTIEAPEVRVAPDGVVPAPLRELGDLVEVRLTPAPSGRGTELAARPNLSSGTRDKELASEIRVALRQSKQLLEAGEVATNEPQPHGHRPATPAGLLVDVLARRSPGDGVL